jgi:hypothetical protein
MVYRQILPETDLYCCTYPRPASFSSEYLSLCSMIAPACESTSRTVLNTPATQKCYFLPLGRMGTKAV